MLFHCLSALALIACFAAGASADSVRTLDGKVIDGTVKLDPKGGLSVSPRSGQSLLHLDFGQLLRVKLDMTETPTDPGTQEFWYGSDIGDVGQGGSHKSANGQLTVEAAGADIAGKVDSCRFVSQTFAGNGEVSARLTPGGETRPNMIAGVMLRKATDPDSPMAALVIGHDGNTRFIVRTNPGEDARVVATSNERLPMSLRLVRKDNQVIALRSADGKQWTRIADAPCNIGPNVLGGVTLASRDVAALCSAVFEKVRVIADEPTGSNVVQLIDLKPLVNKLKKPNAPGSKPGQINTVMIGWMIVQRDLIDGTSCEVRYNLDGKYNQLVGDTFMSDREKAGGSVTFEIDADNDKIYETAKVTGDTPANPLNLVLTGKKELRLLVTDSGNGKTFSSAEFRGMRLVTFSNVRQAARSQTASLVTTSGSTYAGLEIRTVTKDSVQFSRGERRDLSVPANQISRIYMPGLTSDIVAKLPTTGTGVVMINGDFYEGDIDRFENGKVQVNSVIFGPREFILKQDVLALILRPAATDTKPSDYIVETTDGSIFLADVLATESGKLAVTDRSIGKLVIDLRTVREISYGGDKLKWLADLRPRRVDPAPNRSADGFLIDATIFGPSLQLTGVDCDRGVSLAAGGSVTYDLDGHYKTLACVAGVPTDVLPNVSAVFVAESEGKELFRSSPRNSVQDALPISIDTSKVKTITLRVEAEKGSRLPVVGLWGDPLLVKATP